MGKQSKNRPQGRPTNTPTNHPKPKSNNGMPRYQNPPPPPPKKNEK